MRRPRIPFMRAFPRRSARRGAASAKSSRSATCGRCWRSPRPPTRSWPASSDYGLVPICSTATGSMPAARGAVIIWLPVGMMLGNALISPLDRVLDTRKRIIMTCALATIAVLLAFAAVAAHAAARRDHRARPDRLSQRLHDGDHRAWTIGFYSDRQMGRGVTVVNTAVLLGDRRSAGLHRPHCRRAGAGRREPAPGHLPRHLRHARRGSGLRSARLPPMSGRAAERGRGSGTAAVRHCRIGVVP